MGLLVGVELDMMAGPVVEVARDMGVLAITAGKVCVHWGIGLGGPSMVTRRLGQQGLWSSWHATWVCWQSLLARCVRTGGWGGRARV